MMVRQIQIILMFMAAGMLAACGPSLPDSDELLILRPLDCEIRAEGPDALIHALNAAIPSFDEERHLRRMLRIDQAITDRPVFTGNRVRLLIDGPMAYEAIFEAMRNAKHHIHVETFILDDEEMGRTFAEILLERRKAGVEVRIIYDAFGILNAEEEYFERLKQSGVQLFKYNPLDPTEDFRVWRINQRHHRKILVVDGKIAFTGGMNISGVYSHSSFSPPAGLSKLKDRWRDTHIRVEGPIVTEFQRLFLRLWGKLHEIPALSGAAYYPETAFAGPSLVRMMVSSAGDAEYDIYQVYLSIFAQARRRIWVTQGYFSPDERLLGILEAGARRGVDIRLLLPGATDSWITINSSRAHYQQLLEAGVRIFERKDALQHAKTAVVDTIWSTVGSANLDYRSFLHANEANAIIYGEEFGGRMEDIFLIDQKKNEEITLTVWQQRPWYRRPVEFFASFFDYWL